MQINYIFCFSLINLTFHFKRTFKIFLKKVSKLLNGVEEKKIFKSEDIQITLKMTLYFFLFFVKTIFLIFCYLPVKDL